MSDETKNCGNCRWWKEIDGPERGECMAPIPFSTFNRGIWIRKTDGTNCPCFSPPIPQEVMQAARIHNESSLPCDSEAHIVASWAIEHLPELKGEQ